MSIGSSGRIVLEVNPELKRRLYSVLAQQGLTLKDWFQAQAADYLRDYLQPSLRLVAEPPSAYNSENRADKRG